MSSLFRSLIEDNQSEEEITQKKRRIAWPLIIGIIISIVAVCLLFIVFLLITLKSSTNYSRTQDKYLKQFIYSSPAAEQLPTEGQLFCWVQTARMYHETRALAVNETWMNRCDHGQLFTSDLFNSTDIPYSTVFAGIPESYYNLFYKSHYAFHYIWNFISKDFEWYMKADDDTYVIVEHLKDYLKTLDHNKPYYLGFKIGAYLENGYNAGGAGYVLSREAVRLFNEKAYNNLTVCPDHIYEDVGMGQCLANIGIFPHDTRTSKGQNRFNTFHPMEVFYGKTMPKMYQYINVKKGYKAIANDVISFHHVSPDEIRLLDITLYQIDRSRV